MLALISTSKNTGLIKNEYLDIIDGCFDDDILQYIAQKCHISKSLKQLFQYFQNSTHISEVLHSFLLVEMERNKTVLTCNEEEISLTSSQTR